MRLFQTTYSLLLFERLAATIWPLLPLLRARRKPREQLLRVGGRLPEGRTQQPTDSEFPEGEYAV